MLLFFFLFNCLTNLQPSQATVRIARLENTTLQLTGSATEKTFDLIDHTCDQCICQMLTISQFSKSLACQPKYGTCQILLGNTSAELRADNNSVVYLIDFTQLQSIDETQETTSTPVCQPACLNEGVCIGFNTCQCPMKSWTGAYCQTPTLLQAFWKFDNNFLDEYGIFNGNGINSPTFQSPGIDGYGTCLYLNRSREQMVNVSSPPFFDLSYKSFSLSLWVKATSLRNGILGVDSDSAIFGQTDENIQSRLLHVNVRNNRNYFGFDGDETQGNLSLAVGIWYHLAYVYSNDTQQQFIYINGVLDAVDSPRLPYKGTSGALIIGNNGANLGRNFWDGCLDRISLESREKSAMEILDEATLTVYYPFENNLIDQGPLHIDGTGSDYQFSSDGRSGAALNLVEKNAFVSTGNLILIGTDNRPYSMYLWIRPDLVQDAIIIRISTNSVTSTMSSVTVRLNSIGHLVAEICSSLGKIIIQGPPIMNLAWTQTVVTYSQNNGFRFYANGTLYGTNFLYSQVVSSTWSTVTIGHSVNPYIACDYDIIDRGSYVGLVDEFRLYARELSASNILQMFNA